MSYLSGDKIRFFLEKETRAESEQRHIDYPILTGELEDFFVN